MHAVNEQVGEAPLSSKKESNINTLINESYAPVNRLTFVPVLAAIVLAT